MSFSFISKNRTTISKLSMTNTPTTALSRLSKFSKLESGGYHQPNNNYLVI